MDHLILFSMIKHCWVHFFCMLLFAILRVLVHHNQSVLSTSRDELKVHFGLDRSFTGLLHGWRSSPRHTSWLLSASACSPCFPIHYPMSCGLQKKTLLFIFGLKLVVKAMVYNINFRDCFYFPRTSKCALLDWSFARLISSYYSTYESSNLFQKTCRARIQRSPRSD